MGRQKRVLISLRVTEGVNDMLNQLAHIHRRSRADEFQRIIELYHDKIESEFIELQKQKEQNKKDIL